VRGFYEWEHEAMTEVQWLEQIFNGLGAIHALLTTWTVLLERIAFLSHVVALGVCWIAGCESLKFWIYVKNHKDLW
jgi:hypothetical protein